MISTNSNFSTITYQSANLSFNAVTHTAIGLPVNTTLYVKVISIGINRNGGEDPWYFSNILQSVTDDGVPTPLPATNVTTNSFTANWEVEPEADQYWVEIYDENVKVGNNIFTSNNYHTISSEITGCRAYSYKIKAEISNIWYEYYF